MLTINYFQTTFSIEKLMFIKKRKDLFINVSLGNCLIKYQHFFKSNHINNLTVFMKLSSIICIFTLILFVRFNKQHQYKLNLE